MTNLAEKIVGKELQNLGLMVEEKKATVEVKTPTVAKAERQTTVYKPKTYDTRHKTFKTQNARHKMINEFTSDNPTWTKDWACEVGSKMRQDFWESANGSSDASISTDHMAEIIDLCHRDLGQLLDHLGIVFKPKGNDMFREMLLSIFKEHAVFNNGSMNRNIRIVEEK